MFFIHMQPTDLWLPVLMEAGGMTVVAAMVACGVDHKDALFMDKMQAQGLANNIFDDRFDSWLDLSQL